MLYVKTQVVPRRERYVLEFESSKVKASKGSNGLLLSEVMACYCQKLSGYINTGVEESSELFNAKPGRLSSHSNLCLFLFALL
jgi:hypothetical protein